jgi:hypothetical protein
LLSDAAIKPNELLDHDWFLLTTGCLEPDAITRAMRIQDSPQVWGDVHRADERER